MTTPEFDGIDDSALRTDEWFYTPCREVCPSAPERDCYLGKDHDGDHLAPVEFEDGVRVTKYARWTT